MTSVTKNEKPILTGYGEISTLIHAGVRCSFGKV